jgi:hypothetical protein
MIRVLSVFNAEESVLSRMYLDTEPEAAVSSDDDLAELDSDESDLDRAS